MPPAPWPNEAVKSAAPPLQRFTRILKRLAGSTAPRRDLNVFGTSIASYHFDASLAARRRGDQVGFMNTHGRQLVSGLVATVLGSVLLLPACSDKATSSDGAAHGGSGGSRADSGAGGGKAGAGGGKAGAGGVKAGAGGADTGPGGADPGTGGGLAAAGAAAGDCIGSPPYCRGTNLRDYCGMDPYGPATCENGAWMCSLFGSAPVAAPGCNGRYRSAPGLAGAAGENGGGGEGGAAGAGGQAGG